jgi:nucleoside-diphosphate-sugar epimerase
MTDMKKVIVTGGSGKAGRAVIKELLAYELDVFKFDMV